MTTKHQKLMIALRYYLLGRGWTNASNALELGAQYHTGTRKDGVSPEYSHPMRAAHYVRTLVPHLMYPEDCISAILLHDLVEDYDVDYNTVKDAVGSRAADAIMLLDKRGRTTESYYRSLGLCPITSICKGPDRIDNMSTMHGVFTPEKQLKYTTEVHEHMFPMLKTARRSFPSQEPAYENIQFVLRVQCTAVETQHNASK